MSRHKISIAQTLTCQGGKKGRGGRTGGRREKNEIREKESRVVYHH